MFDSITAQANGYRGRPIDILRVRQADTLHGHARLGLPDEEATAPWTISLTNLIVLPRPLANTMKGPYVPGRRAEALAFTLSVTVTPLVSVTPWVGLAVSQDGVLIE